eukprot:TRINITY_DN8903_c0_g5_i1.p1 TRINITY_DN8903_c0_g5~~TRINITY_DN8903_c0_g5_i1.p1  ORF type:complete len:361 (+),score=100.20 TRINITY_DN8903_c0_g5_i1:63-1145(+)
MAAHGETSGPMWSVTSNATSAPRSQGRVLTDGRPSDAAMGESMQQYSTSPRAGALERKLVLREVEALKAALAEEAEAGLHVRAVATDLERKVQEHAAAHGVFADSLSTLSDSVDALEAKATAVAELGQKQHGAVKTLSKRAEGLEEKLEEKVKKVHEAIANNNKRAELDRQVLQNELRGLSRQLEETNKRSLVAATKVEYMASEAGKRSRGGAGHVKSAYSNKSSGVFYQLVGYAVKGFYSPMFLLYETLTALSLVKRILVLASGHSPAQKHSDPRHLNHRSDTEPLDAITAELGASVAAPENMRGHQDDSDEDGGRREVRRGDSGVDHAPCLLDSLDQHTGLAREQHGGVARRRPAAGK